MSTLGQLWNEMAASYRATSVVKGRTTSAGKDYAQEAAAAAFEQKHQLFRDFTKWGEEYVKDRNDDRLAEYKAEVALRAEAVKAQQAIIRTLIEGGVRLTTTQMQVVGANSRALLAAKTKLATAVDDRGARWVRSELARMNLSGVTPDGRVLRDNQEQQLQLFREDLKSWDMTDPMTLGIYEELNRIYSPSLTATVLPGLQAAATRIEATKKAEAIALVNFQELKVPPGGVTQEAIDEHLRSISAIDVQPVGAMQAVTQAELEADPRFAVIEKRRADLEKELLAGGTSAPESTLGDYGGLSRTRALDVLQDPKFVAWAKDHGFHDLGTTGSDGTYSLGKDARRALDAALRAQEKGNVPKEVEDVRVPLAGLTSRVSTINFPAPDRFSFFVDADGVQSAYVKRADGSIVRTNFLDPSKDVVVKGDEALAEMQRTLEATDSTEFSATGLPGGKPVNLEALRAAFKDGSIGTYTDTEAELDMSGQETPPLAEPGKAALDYVEGKRLSHRVGDDPDVVMRVKQRDGSIVVLGRKSKEDPWGVIEGTALSNPSAPPVVVEPTYPQLMGPDAKLRPAKGNLIQDALALLRGKEKLPGEQVPLPRKAGEPPDKVINPLDGKDKTPESPVRVAPKSSAKKEVITAEDLGLPPSPAVAAPSEMELASSAGKDTKEVAVDLPPVRTTGKVSPLVRITEEDLNLRPMQDARGRARTEYEPAASTAKGTLAGERKVRDASLAAALSSDEDTAADAKLAKDVQALDTTNALPGDIQDTLDAKAPGEGMSAAAWAKAREDARKRKEAGGQEAR